MTRVKKKSNLWIAAIALIVSIAALSFGVVGFTASRETSDVQEIGSSDWSLGTVNDTGKIVDSKQSIYTEALYEVKALDIKLDEDKATVTYRVVFYDENKDYISSTEELEADFDNTSVPENAKYFRVVVTPYAVDDEPVKISGFTIRKYSKQLTITY